MPERTPYNDALAITLDSLSEPPEELNQEAKKQAEQLHEQEVQEIERQEKRQNLERDDILNSLLDSKLKLREKFSTYVFWLVACYLFIAFLIVIGVGFTCFKFYLDYKVLIAMLTSTTATVLGLFLVIVRRIFDSNGAPKRRE